LRCHAHVFGNQAASQSRQPGQSWRLVSPDVRCSRRARFRSQALARYRWARRRVIIIFSLFGFHRILDPPFHVRLTFPSSLVYRARRRSQPCDGRWRHSAHVGCGWWLRCHCLRPVGRGEAAPLCVARPDHTVLLMPRSCAQPLIPKLTSILTHFLRRARSWST
jgi:hypothetical protein